MAASSRRVPLQGSERPPLPNAQVAGAIDPGERIEITVVVRPRAGTEPQARAAATGAQAPGERQHLTREELAAQAGADQADLDRVTAFARDHGLEVLETSAPRRTVRLAGPASAMNAAFGVTLHQVEDGATRFRGREGSVHLPEDVAEVVHAVMGLDDRPQARPRRTAAAVAGPRAVAALTTPQVAKLYDFPTGVDGSGECVGIIELGGGYKPSDLTTYFQGLKITPPTVVAVPVDGAKNAPTGDPNGPDAEVLLDIEVVGAIAPKARIAVYFAPNTDAGFLDAITTAVHDTTNRPSVISISWGAPESQWTAQAMTAMDTAFADAAAVGVTVCAASGDNGATDGETDGHAHADFPASSPHALGCGGTTIDARGTKITTEKVWNDGSGGASGGGISDQFALPAFQQGAKVPTSVNPGKRKGRGVPDVCGDADPASGYRIVVNGQQVVIGGTSAVAPLWSGLLALVNQRLGAKTVGYLNPLLYGSLAGTGALVDITQGNNRVSGHPGYTAGTGWDACTGLGRPDGAKLLAALTASSAPGPTPTPPAPPAAPTAPPSPQPTRPTRPPSGPSR